MDTFKFPRPQSRCILHQARFQDATGALALAQSTAEQQQPQPSIPSITPTTTSRASQQIYQRTIEEHPLNRQVELFIPRLRPTTDTDALATSVAHNAFDPITYFQSRTNTSTNTHTSTATSTATQPAPLTPLFYYDATVPFSTLLSDTFLTRLLHGRVYGLSIGTSIDHTNGVQLTPNGLLRLYVDTDSFEALGLDAPAAHSEFRVCSDAGAKSLVRERLITIDLIPHARQVALHTQTSTEATTTTTPSSSSSATASTPSKNKKGDKKLDRLRWTLGQRCAPVRMHLLFLNDTGECTPFELVGASDVRRIEIEASSFQFGVNGSPISVPRVSEFTQFLPDLAVVDAITQQKQAYKKQKKQHGSVTGSSESEEKESPTIDLTQYQTSTSVFPKLSDGRSAADVWTDMLTYLGLVAVRMESCLADPNPTTATLLTAFLQQPLCPYLTFDTSSPLTVQGTNDEAMDEEKEEEEDMISLNVSSRKATSGPNKRKRILSTSAPPLSDTPSTLVASAHALDWTGFIPPNFILDLVGHSRHLLAHDPHIPFIALTVFGFDSALTSWRDKHHQIWMSGAGTNRDQMNQPQATRDGGGGGENHYTLVILPDSSTSAPHDRMNQQYVIGMMIGELDRTH